MNRLQSTAKWLFGFCLVGMLAGAAFAQSSPVRLSGTDCQQPPVLHCGSRDDCPMETLTANGPAVEPETGLPYFVDYPCDLQPEEDVTVILLLHGAGSNGNWVRHYFPAMDLVDQYRLVVITPSAPTQTWRVDEDEYLRNTVAAVFDQIGDENVSSFWLVGHSQGGLTSNRLACTSFFRDRIDGWLSLSGGRIGAAPPPDGFGPPGMSPGTVEQMFGSFPMIEGANGPERAYPGKAVTPTCDMNYIFSGAEHEIIELPRSSPWAEKYHCDPRIQLDDVVDGQKGYVSNTRSGSPSPAWGREARGGVAEIFVFPNCEGGRLVADVVRLDKGHTEGLEPNITRRLVEMMLSAPTE